MIEKGRLFRPWSVRARTTSDSSSSTTVPTSAPSSSSPTGNRPRFPSYASESSHTSRPRLHSSGESSYNSTMSSSTRKERVSAEEERLFKARKMVDSHLKKVSLLDKPLSLNRETGMCYFPYQKFIVVMEVPADHPSSLYMYTCVCRCEEAAGIAQVLRTAMELNYMQHRTRGATLGMENTEVNLCLSTPLFGLTPTGLQKRMDDFLQTASEVHVILERAKKVL